jgi:16S rRNA (cytidine1402-2'-O)-methyltransferase
VGSGLAGPRWGFEGFLPRTGRERRERLARIGADDRSTVLFEAPGRLARTLGDLAAACGPERAAAVCRELTKLHEQIARGTLASLIERIADGSIPTRGEAVIVVSGAPAPAAAVSADSTREDAPARPASTTVEAARARVAALIRDGLGSSEAARQIAAQTGIPRRQLYAARHSEVGEGTHGER